MRTCRQRRPPTRARRSRRSRTCARRRARRPSLRGRAIPRDLTPISPRSRSNLQHTSDVPYEQFPVAYGDGVDVKAGGGLGGLVVGGAETGVAEQARLARPVQAEAQHAHLAPLDCNRRRVVRTAAAARWRRSRGEGGRAGGRGGRQGALGGAARHLQQSLCSRIRTAVTARSSRGQDVDMSGVRGRLFSSFRRSKDETSSRPRSRAASFHRPLQTPNAARWHGGADP